MSDRANPGTVGFLGTGIMGLAMARNLLGAGFAVRAWNRTRERAEPLAEDGAEIAGSAAEAADGADFVVSMLSDADAVLAVMEEALPAAPDDAVWVQSSTIGIEGAERCVELARRHGRVLVDAPVLGTKQPAEQGKLVVLASGPHEALERCSSLFDAVAMRTIRLGDAGEGTRLKLVTNAWVVSAVEGLAETLALAGGLGVDPRLFLEAIDGGALDMPYVHMKGEAMIARSFPPSFPLELAAKDARLLVEAAGRHELDLPLLRAVAARMAEGVEAGHGAEDLAATYLTSAPRA